MSGTSAGSTGGSDSSGTGAASTSITGGTTIQGTTFDLKQKAPKAETSGWTRSEREKLTNEGLVKFKENVVKKVIKTPLSANLSVSSYKASEMDSKNNFFHALGQWSVAALVFQSFLKSNFMSSVFTIVRKDQVDDPNNPGTLIDTVVERGDLLSSWHSMTLEEIFESCSIHMKYSTSVVEAQNLNLSWEFLLANVDQDLKASVIAEVSRFVSRDMDAAQSGPMAFYVIANRIVRSSDALAHNAITGLMGMGLIHFKGEDVIECVSVLRNVLLFLGAKAPPTIMDTLIDIFLRCSSPVFVSFIRNLKDFHYSRIDTAEKLFLEAQLKYNELIIKPNGWLRSSKSKSAFLAEMPELAAVLEETTPSPKSSGSGQPSNQPETDRKGRKIDRTPPGNGQPKKRKNAEGRLEYWCSKCNRWGAHLDDNHDEWWAKYNEKRNADKASKDATPSETTSSGTPPSMKRANYCELKPLRGSSWIDAYDSDQSF